MEDSGESETHVSILWYSGKKAASKKVRQLYKGMEKWKRDWVWRNNTARMALVNSCYTSIGLDQKAVVEEN